MTTNKALNTEITDQPAIYIGTYAKYNNGSIAGKWVDLTQITSKDELYEIAAEIHADEEDPEFMFQDWQSIPERFISKSWISDDYFEYAEKMAGMSDDEKNAFEAFASAGYDENDFEEANCGYWSSEEDFARDLIEQCYDIEKMMGNLSYYFDYEAFARDLFINDYWMDDKTGFVFRRM